MITAVTVASSGPVPLRLVGRGRHRIGKGTEPNWPYLHHAEDLRCAHHILVYLPGKWEP